MSQLNNALGQVGVKLPGGALGAAIDEFSLANLSPNTIASASKSFLSDAVRGSVGAIGGRIPGLGQLATGGGLLGALLPSAIGRGTDGIWESVHYADDLNSHHPKFKFLFKVKFEGFGTESFYRYVVRCDKPRVRFNHTDINYYNFRSRVLTSVTYDPLTITFIDEITNSVNHFFVNYLQKRTGTGNGNWGIDRGFSSASSIPYSKGHTDAGQKITIEQVFANGTLSNRFEFINPRIESFDFDELNMDDNVGSLLTCSFSYDAIRMETVKPSEKGTLYAWGQTDLLRGGGTSGPENAGSQSLSANFSPSSSGGAGIGGGGSIQALQVGAAFAKLKIGSQINNFIPKSLSDLVSPVSGLFKPMFNQSGVIGSAADRVQRGVQDTLTSIRSGANLVFGGRPGPTTIQDLSSRVPDQITSTGQQTFSTDPQPPITSSSDP